VVARNAEQLHAAAVDYAHRGRYAAARSALDRAAASTSDPDLRARIAGTLAYVLGQNGSMAEAEQLCREALAAPDISRHTAAILAGQLGALAEQAGRLRDAEEWLGRGIDGLADDEVAQANLLMNRSVVNMQLHRLSQAADHSASAAEIYARNRLANEEAQARHNLGYIALLQGDLVGAMQRMAEARPTIAAQSPVAAGISDVDRAEVLRDAGLTQDAEQLLERAAVVFGAHRLPKSRAGAEFNLARSLLMHDPVRAGRVAAAAERRFRSLGNDTWAARADALRLRAGLSGGGVRLRGGRVSDPRRVPAADEIESAASALDRLGFRNEGAALRMTELLWRARHGRSRDSAAVRPPAAASMEVRLLSSEARAARATAAGRHGLARRHAADGLDALATWQNAFGSLDLQTSISMHASGLMFAGLHSAVRSGRPDVVFEWSERARHLSQQVVPLRPPPDPELASDLAELRMLRADNPDWLSDPRAMELRDRARERQWSQTGSASFELRVSLEELRDGLNAETALIAYVFTGDDLAALVVTDTATRLIPLAGDPTADLALAGLRADLDMSATVRTGPMADVVRRTLEDRMAGLSRTLLDGPVAVADRRRLVITVPGVLAGIPWAMLPGMQGHVFTLAASATRWLRMHRDPGGFGLARAGFAVGPRVARGDEEVATAANAWPSARILRAEEAAVDAVTELASGVDVLHIAAHGRHAADNPLFSGLELADGALFGYDIDRMPQVPTAVILSACEVGRSSVRWGEEAIGMTRIWLHAGVRSVVATPVIVADDVACELLGAMHDGLAAGAPPAEALAAASERTGLVAPFQTHGAGF
jgi:tetratricopeptide (TPR) repeat protein